MRLLIKNGIVIDPTQNLRAHMDILVEGTKIAGLAPHIHAAADTVIDASGKLVLPGLVDMHVHLREPGREDKETIASGTQAAVRGGVTTVLAMPNTFPAIDSLESVQLLKTIIKNSACANVCLAAAITTGRLGRSLTDVSELKKHGVIAISDDGASVDDDTVMWEALKNAAREKVLTICHCEDMSLSRKGVVNLGVISTKLGLRGISRESEYKRITRDLQLAEKANAAVHIAHISCKESVDIVAGAKKKGIKVTAETAPHYFSLTEEDIIGYNTNMKMNPPLRTKRDVEAIKQGLKNGVIDVIASDHAPHTENEKDIEFDRAEFGVVGLETELAVSITELIKTGILDWPELVEKMAVNPARILGIHKGTLQAGRDADITVISQDEDWVVQKGGFVSKSKNSAFLGRKLQGVVVCTVCAGKIAYSMRTSPAAV
jgi:dihydroorotase